MGDGRRSTWVEGTSSDGRDTTRLRALFAPSTRSDGTAHVDFCTMPKGRFGSKALGTATTSGATSSTGNGEDWRSAGDPIAGTYLLGAEVEEILISLYLRAFCKGKRILYVDAEVPNGAFDLWMAEQSRAIMRILLSH
jgi:hypothetical protein